MFLSGQSFLVGQQQLPPAEDLQHILNYLTQHVDQMSSIGASKSAKHNITNKTSKNSEHGSTKNSSPQRVNTASNNSQPFLKTSVTNTSFRINTTQCNNNNTNDQLLLTILPRARIGNQLFQYASLLGIASRNKRTPFLMPEYYGYTCKICKLFKITNVRDKNSFNTSMLSSEGVAERVAARYYKKFECLPEKHLLLRGFLQSFKYFKDVQAEVRKELQFNDTVSKMADALLLSAMPSAGNEVTVGIHVRRGDYLDLYWKRRGARVPSKSYFDKASKYFRNKYKHVIFLVASTDMDWATENILVEEDVVLIEAASGEVIQY